MCVCPLCLLAYLRNHMSKLHKIFCTCYLWSWLGHTRTVQYIMYSGVVGDIKFAHMTHANRVYVQSVMSKAPFTRYNLLSNWFWNRFDNRLNVFIHDTINCQTGLTTGCIVYTNIQRVVNPIWQPVWQLAVSCIQPVVKLVVQPGLTINWTKSGCSFNRLSNRFDSCLTTGWMFVCTIQPVVKLVVQPDWQPVVLCKRGIRLRCVWSEMCVQLCWCGMWNRRTFSQSGSSWCRRLSIRTSTRRTSTTATRGSASTPSTTTAYWHLSRLCCSLHQVPRPHTGTSQGCAAADIEIWEDSLKLFCLIFYGRPME